MGSVKKLVKKVTRPKVLLPLLAIGTGGAALGAFGPAAKAAMVGTAGIPATAAMSGIHPAISAVAPTKGILGGLLGTGGELSLAGKGILGTGAGLGLASLMKEEPKPLEDSGMTQAVYDAFLRQGRNLYTDEELNDYFAPLGAALGGEFTRLEDPFPGFTAVQRPMFPGLNYSGLNLVDRRPKIYDATSIFDERRLMQSGGSIRDSGMVKGSSNMGPAGAGGKAKREKSNIMRLSDSFKQSPMDNIILEQPPLDIPAFGPLIEDEDSLGFNEFPLGGGILKINPITEGMIPQGLELEYRVPFSMKDGGKVKPKKRKDALEEIEEQKRIQRDALFPDGSPGANEDSIFQQMENIRNKEKNRMGRNEGGLMQLAMSDPNPMAERFDMMENLALDIFKKPLRSLSDAEIMQLEEVIENMMPMANGGSVPQTKGIPNGMQIDGRGGGFIPMGAKEKKDDVPAMLAKNEFVMTSDAVRGMGGGSAEKGAQKMYDLMNALEAKV